MQMYLVKVRIDGNRTEEIVYANSTSQARELVEARYPLSDVSFISVSHIHNR